MEYKSEVRDALVQLLTEQSARIITHLAQVAELATQTAIQFNLSPSLVELTRLGAEVHEVGKVGIPARILEKPGPLDVDEQWFCSASQRDRRKPCAGDACATVEPDLDAVSVEPIEDLNDPTGALLCLKLPTARPRLGTPRFIAIGSSCRTRRLRRY